MSETFKIVDNAEDCTIKQFMKASFEGKYEVLIIEGNPPEQKLKEAFEYIYAQYVDISGLYQSHEFEIVAYIESLDRRITVMKRFVEIQKAFISHFDMPYLPGLSIAEKYGHKLYWDPNYPESFMKKLDSIHLKEAKYKIKVDDKVKELLDLRKKKVTKEHTVLESRKDFISMLTRLQQQRFVIDRNVTSVEDLAVIIRDSKEQAESERTNNQYKRR